MGSELGHGSPVPQRALLLIDLQRDFLEVDGRMPVDVESANQVLSNAKALLTLADALKLTIVFIQNRFRKNDWIGNVVHRFSAIDGTFGAEIDPRVPVTPSAIVLPKARADGFSNPDLDAILQKASVKEVIILGVMTEACVNATSKGAIRRGYRVIVASDAVASTRAYLQRIGIRRLLAAGAALKTSDQIQILLRGQHALGVHNAGSRQSR
jgi:nicotinamidase-related amidase